MNDLNADISRLRMQTGGGFRFVSELISPAFLAIVVYRFFRMLRLGAVPCLLIRVPIEKLTELVSGISLPSSCSIGGGLRIHHFGGIVIHDSVHIGANATLYHQVTIGLSSDTDPRAPILGDDCLVGAGAKVLGPITIGNHVRIGANAVVVTDIPDSATAVGIPAKVITTNRC